MSTAATLPVGVKFPNRARDGSRNSLRCLGRNGGVRPATSLPA